MMSFMKARAIGGDVLMGAWKQGRRGMQVLWALWLAVLIGGAGGLWSYANRPGIQADAPLRWPGASAIRPEPGRPTLLVFAHPRCPCTRASIEELSRLLARV